MQTHTHPQKHTHTNHTMTTCPKIKVRANWHTASHCNKLQHTAPHCITLEIHCTTLQHTATHCNTLHSTATHCNTLQKTATQSHCKTLQQTATHCNTLQHTAPNCNTLHHTATHCNTLHHTAPHCNTFHAIDTPDNLKVRTNECLYSLSARSIQIFIVKINSNILYPALQEVRTLCSITSYFWIAGFWKGRRDMPLLCACYGFKHILCVFIYINKFKYFVPSFTRSEYTVQCYFWILGFGKGLHISVRVVDVITYYVCLYIYMYYMGMYICISIYIYIPI